MEPEPGQSDGAGFPNLDLLLLFSALNPAIAANEQKLSNEKILFHHKSLSRSLLTENYTFINSTVNVDECK